MLSIYTVFELVTMGAKKIDRLKSTIKELRIQQNTRQGKQKCLPTNISLKKKNLFQTLNLKHLRHFLGSKEFE